MGKRRWYGIIISGVAAVAIALGAGAATADEPEGQTTHDARGEALDIDYRLGDQPSSATAPAWYTALMTRSDALNRLYGLGEYAKKPSSTTPPPWLKGLMARSEALNRMYGPSEYATSPASPIRR